MTDAIVKPLDEVELSTRLSRVLKNMGLRTIGQLAGLAEVDLLQREGIGVKTCQEAKEILSAYGLSFEGNPRPSVVEVSRFKPSLAKRSEKQLRHGAIVRAAFDIALGPRNAAIVESFCAGASLTALGKQYDLSLSSIRCILAHECRKAGVEYGCLRDRGRQTRHDLKNALGRDMSDDD